MRISKTGDAGARAALYQAANVIPARPVKSSALKSWAARLAARSEMRKAKVAPARKLAAGSIPCRMPCPTRPPLMPLQAIIDLDLDELAAIVPPRGYERDGSSQRQSIATLKPQKPLANVNQKRQSFLSNVAGQFILTDAPSPYCLSGYTRWQGAAQTSPKS